MLFTLRKIELFTERFFGEPKVNVLWHRIVFDSFKSVDGKYFCNIYIYIYIYICNMYITKSSDNLSRKIGIAAYKMNSTLILCTFLYRLHIFFGLLNDTDSTCK